MIDGYKIKDGKVIVINYDEEDNVVEEERIYQDNIVDLLKAENIEEHLKKMEEKVNKSIKSCSYMIAKQKDKIATGIFLILMFILLGSAISIGGSLIPVVASSLGSLIFFGLRNIIPSKKEIKKLQKEIAGLEFTLEGIVEQKKINQKDLRRLRNDDRCECDNIKFGYKQFDLVEIQQMDKYLDLWRFIGENEDYCKWAQDNNHLYGTLNQRGFYNEEEIKTLKRILNRNNKR